MAGPSRKLPSKDKKRPLMEHIDELRTRLLIIIVGIIVLIAISFPLSFELVEPIVSPVAPPDELYIYDPLETIKMQLLFSVLFAVAFGLPLIMHQTYEFMEPGLFENERRFFAILTPSSILLFLLGATIAYFFIVPPLAYIALFIGEGMAIPEISIAMAFNFVVALMATFGFLFQLPIIILFAVRIELISPQFLIEKRIYIYLGFFIVATLLSPDPTFTSQTIVTVVFIILYEISSRLSWYLTPKTDSDITNFLERFKRLGPWFSGSGVALGFFISINIDFVWLPIVVAISFILYIAQRFSVLLIEWEKMLNLGMIGTFLFPLISYLLLEYYYLEYNLLFFVFVTAGTAILTYLLEKLHKRRWGGKRKKKSRNDRGMMGGHGPH